MTASVCSVSDLVHSKTGNTNMTRVDVINVRQEVGENENTQGDGQKIRSDAGKDLENEKSANQPAPAGDLNANDGSEDRDSILKQPGKLRATSRRMTHNKRKALQIEFSPHNPTTTGGGIGIAVAGGVDFRHPRHHHRPKNFFKRHKNTPPNHFLLGGNFRDPLNLAALMEKGSRGNTPATSPRILPSNLNEPVEILIPQSVKDPLNLNSSDPDDVPLPHHMRHHPRPHTHKRKRRDSLKVSDLQSIADLERKSRTGPDYSVESLSDTELAIMSPPPAKVNRKSLEFERKRGASGSPSPKSKRQLDTTGASPAIRTSPSPSHKRPRILAGLTSTTGPSKFTKQTHATYDPIVSPVTAVCTISPQPVPISPKKAERPRNERTVSETTVESLAKGTKKPKKDPARFRYGNYNQYYGKRLPGEDEDPRLKHLQKEWLADKSVLDIGCNIGHMTILVARDFNPQKIVGLDIDSHLVGIARKNVRHYLDEAVKATERNNGGGKTTTKVMEAVSQATISHFPPSFSREYGPLSAPPLILGPPNSSDQQNANAISNSETSLHSQVTVTDGCSTTSSASVTAAGGNNPSSATGRDTTGGTHGITTCSKPYANQKRNVQPNENKKDSVASLPGPGSNRGRFPNNIIFRQGNYVMESDSMLDNVLEEYDTIMALSVTKWIHLNWGDTGLKRFFKRIYRNLKPGGRFIVEPQPWEGYKKRKKLSEELMKNYESIRMKPHMFTDYLLSPEVGFQSVEIAGIPQAKAKGFQRPIQMFRKPKGATGASSSSSLH